jgi:glutathione S-transferase
MKLLGSAPSPYTRKVRVVLAEKKIDCDFEVADVNPPENPVNPIFDSLILKALVIQSVGSAAGV